MDIMKKKRVFLFLLLIVIFLLVSSSGVSILHNETPNMIARDNDLENLAYICTEQPGYFNEKRYQQLAVVLTENTMDDFTQTEETSEKTSPISESLDGGLAESDWPMKCHDTHHTGRSPYSTENNSYAELWNYYSDTWTETSPAIGLNGIIYVGGGYQGLSYYLFALHENGTLKWQYKTGGMIHGCCPAIDQDGTIYIGSWDHYLYALYSNGTQKWKLDAGAIIDTSPAIDADGTIYIGTMLPKNQIIAVTKNGTLKWRFQTGDVITSDPAISDDGTIYVGSHDHYIYALYPNKTLRWKYLTGDEVRGEPSIGPDGTIYIGSWDGYLYALNPDGSLNWRTSIGLGTATNPALSEDGIIYVGAYYTMYAIYANNGSVKWAIDLGGHADSSSPCISADGTIYIGVEIDDGDGGDILAINPDGTEKWRKRIGNCWAESSPAIASDGTVYICSSSLTGADAWGQLHAFGHGPLEVDALGPYQGYLNKTVQFNAYTAGGDPPYTYRWDFGDGNNSYEKKPTHAYGRVGVYNATFTLTDSKMNSTSDNTTVTIRYSPPRVDITRPGNGIYFLDINIFPWYTISVVIGRITVKATVEQQDLPIGRVEFYFEDRLQGTVTSEPYQYTIKAHSIGTKKIMVVAYDTENNSASAKRNVNKFF